MGISDRDYARAGGGGASGTRLGAGSLRLLSFNGWIILINVAVFVLGVMLSVRGVPVLLERAVSPDVPRGAKLAITDQMLTTGGQLVAPGTSLRSPAFFRRPIVMQETGQVVGSALYQVMDPLTAFGHFSTYQGFQRLEVWRLVTFQFLHGGVMHLAMNMLGLWLFGGVVERSLGFKKYAAFYLVCGIFGGLMYLTLNFLGNLTHVRIPGLLFNQTTMPLVGASAGVFGVIVACAYLEPRQKVFIWFIPIGIPMPVFAYGYVALSVVNLLTGSANAGGEAAHVGGAIAGYYFIRHSHLLRDFFDIFGDSREPRSTRGNARRHDRGPSEAEVDRVLEKVRLHGLDGLNAADKKILQADTARRRRGGA